MELVTISAQIISSYNPCKDRFDNFKNAYPNYEGVYEDFLDLPLISYEDKIWVSRRFLNKNQLIHFAILCAESVLNIYENKYPEDMRIRDLLNFMKTIVDFTHLDAESRGTLLKLRQAAYAAADAADAAAYAADAATYAAYDAAAYAAYAADAAAYAAYAADAATYAAYDAAAYAAYAAAAYATDAIDAAAIARTTQQNLNLEFLKVVSRL